MIDKHTYGGNDASEVLADLLNKKYPKQTRRVSNLYHGFNKKLRILHHSITDYGFLISLLELVRDNEMENLKKSCLPEELKSYVRNVMMASFRTYNRIANSSYNEIRRKQMIENRTKKLE